METLTFCVRSAALNFWIPCSKCVVERREIYSVKSHFQHVLDFLCCMPYKGNSTAFIFIKSSRLQGIRNYLWGFLENCMKIRVLTTKKMSAVGMLFLAICLACPQDFQWMKCSCLFPAWALLVHLCLYI